MSVEIAWKQNNLVTDFHLLKLLQVVFGFGLQFQQTKHLQCNIIYTTEYLTENWISNEDRFFENHIATLALDKPIKQLPMPKQSFSIFLAYPFLYIFVI